MRDEAVTVERILVNDRSPAQFYLTQKMCLREQGLWLNCEDAIGLK